MSKAPTLSDITSGYGSQSLFNNNWDAIQEAFENTLSLDGSTPNQMTADIDLNSNDLLNVNTMSANFIELSGQKLVNAAVTPDWEGAWATSTDYAINDLVRQSGNVYICLEAHTSGTFSTDLTANKWELFASKGDSGAGSGDLLASNNLSDLDDADTALANLGAGTVGTAIFKDATASDVRTEIDAQQQDPILDDLAGLTQAANEIPYFDSATTASTLNFHDEDDMSSDDAAGVPSQQSVKAYVGTESASVDRIKAWVRFNGTGTVSIIDSYNVTNITDNGIGNYTINLSITMPNSTYIALISSRGSTQRILSTTTTSVNVSTGDSNSNAQNHDDVHVVVIG